jgi:uncharacterized membrane protein
MLSSPYELNLREVPAMTKAARSLLAFGIYLIALGFFLLIAPNTLITLFGLPAVNDVWIRVVGMVLVLFAFYDIQAARKEMTDFFRWSVVARASVIVFFAGFVLAGLVKPILLLFGGVDLAAAIWTQLALRTDGKA